MGDPGVQGRYEPQAALLTAARESGYSSIMNGSEHRMDIAVGLSGGVDSAVTAALLKAAGHRVRGVIMKIWDGRALDAEPGRHACYGPGEAEDLADAERIAGHLEIPLHVIDLAAEYSEQILARCRREYRAGLTPNPCVHCNRLMKFELIPARLRAAGIPVDRFATGHYARIARDDSRGRLLLLRGVDPEKDQSYFLYQLTQALLSQTLFPLGEMTKDEIRRLARERDLPVAEKAESQDFVSGGYGTIFGSPGRPGPILSAEGAVLGEHRGIEHYTVGQRRGLGIAHPEPLYVLAIDAERNAVIAGPAEKLHEGELEAVGLNWIAIDDLTEARRLQARIRYRHRAAPALVEPLARGRVRVRFDEPQRAIAPGQAVVFYDGELVVGGGLIAKV